MRCGGWWRRRTASPRTRATWSARTTKSAGFGVFSLNGAYKVNTNLKLSAGVDNLFGKAYAEHLNPGRERWVRLPGKRPTAGQRARQDLLDKVDFSF